MRLLGLLLLLILLLLLLFLWPTHIVIIIWMVVVAPVVPSLAVWAGPPPFSTFHLGLIMSECATTMGTQPIRGEHQTRPEQNRTEQNGTETLSMVMCLSGPIPRQLSGCWHVGTVFPRQPNSPPSDSSQQTLHIQRILALLIMMQCFIRWLGLYPSAAGAEAALSFRPLPIVVTYLAQVFN